MFKQFACLGACCLFVVAFAGLSGAALAQGLDDGKREPPPQIVGAELTHEFVRDILAIHPALQAAEAALEAARARERSADRPRYNPSLGLDAEKAAARIYQAQISQTVDWAGKKKAAYAVDRKSVV